MSRESNRSRAADQQHLAWVARSFGRPDYLPLGPDDLGALASVGAVVTRYPGTHLFRQSQPAIAAYLIQEGQVDLYRGAKPNRRVVSRVGEGAVIGDIAMFAGVPYMSSAAAVTPVTALQFDRERLLPELARHPALCLRWLVAALRQLEGTQRRVIHLMHKTVLAQVADLLAEESPGEIRISQTTIATLLGVSRQSVNEALSQLRSDGIVETGYRFVRVLDPDRLLEASG
ncbi:MAG TPA: Crp/Fnr family transcriptional regulator [Acidimicrobiia bacterium]